MMKAANIAVAALILAALAGPSLAEGLDVLITQIDLRADATWDMTARMFENLFGFGG